jgi:hypothetical protein
VTGFIRMPRNFLFKTPDEYDIKGWVDLFISSDDGTPLEAIEGTTKRFKDGYNWFGKYPEKVLSFLGKYMD